MAIGGRCVACQLGLGHSHWARARPAGAAGCRRIGGYAGLHAAKGLGPRSAPMIEIPASIFWMGSDHHYPEEAPARRVAVDAFMVDRTPVTNAGSGGRSARVR